MHQIREDSVLMAEYLEVIIRLNKPENFLDMECDSGIHSKTAIKTGVAKKNILAVDIEGKALKETSKLGVRVLKSNLFRLVKGKFDLIAFNPHIFLLINMIRRRVQLAADRDGKL